MTADSSQRRSRLGPKQHVALAVVMLACFVRAGLWHQYDVVRGPDSGTYERVASALLNGGLLEDEGGRTPGYPMLLAVAGLMESRVWLLQMVAGVTISIMLYYCCYRLTNSLFVSAAVGISHSLNLAQIFYEANIASETLATFFVTATAAALLVALDAKSSPQRGRSFMLLAAFLGAAAALTRPQYVFLPAVVALVALLTEVRRRRSFGLQTCLWAVACVAPGMIAVLAWASFNYVRHDYFTVTTLMGINLTNHTIVLAESAPEQYAGIADTLIRYRDAKIQRTGRHSMAVWEALSELQQQTGLERPALSKELAGLSFAVILRHPVRYAQSVAHGWKDFWMVPISWRPDVLRTRLVKGGLLRIWTAEKWLLRLCNAAFVTFVALVAVGWPSRLRAVWDIRLSAISSIVLGSSFIQALVEYGENPRYAVSVQPLIVLIIIVVFYRFYVRRARSSNLIAPIEEITT